MHKEYLRRGKNIVGRRQRMRKRELKKSDANISPEFQKPKEAFWPLSFYQAPRKKAREILGGLLKYNLCSKKQRPKVRPPDQTSEVHLKKLKIYQPLKA